MLVTEFYSNVSGKVSLESYNLFKVLTNILRKVSIYYGPIWFH